MRSSHRVVQGMFALKGIPSEIGRLEHLAHLELAGNDAVSSLPSEVGSLLSVKSLYAPQSSPHGGMT